MGLTRDGGPSYYGTVFRVDPSDDSFATILHFTGSQDARGPLDPTNGLTGDGHGLLWGTPYRGGLTDHGTIYKVHPLTGTITTVVDFTGVGGPAPGAAPYGTLVRDGAGFFWGSTIAGGAAGTGSIFKVEIATGAVTSLAEFKGPNDPSGVVTGQYPEGELVSDGADFFWGTTTSGGTGGKGTVFKVHAASGELTTVVHFAGTGQPVNGAQPTAGLCADGAGFLWGTTLFGGTHGGGAPGGGTVFKVNIVTGVITTVANFTGPGGPLVGQAPRASLVPDSEGHLWGTTSGGGPNYEY